MQMTITVPGTPIAKKRPRFVRRGKFVQTYNEQETEEGRFLLHAIQQINGSSPLDGPLAVSMRFFFPRPKSHFGSGKNAGVLKNSAPAYHIAKPDTDNLIKFVCDCLNGHAWKDDVQVVSLIAKKEYCYQEPKTEITIERIEQ